MKRYFFKLISIALILSLFGSCMTVAPDNRDKAMAELSKLRNVSVSGSPLVSDIGPVRTITSTTYNAAFMAAGQVGVQLNYEYFIILDSQSSQNIQGYMSSYGGGISTTTTHRITVAYTNDENLQGRYIAKESLKLLDGLTFITKGGKAASWTLFGTSLFLGPIIMFSGASRGIDDPSFDRRISTGVVLMIGSPLFLIPLFWTYK